MKIEMTKSSADFKKGFMKATKMILGWYRPDITMEEFKGMLEASVILQELMEKEFADENK